MLPAAVAMLLGNSVASGSDDLDATLAKVELDQEDLELLDVGFTDDDESDGKQTDWRTLSGF